MSIEPLLPIHAKEVLEIYRQGIATGISTFETEAPDWAKFDKKFLPHSRLVLTANKQVIGFATLAPVSNRACYSGVGEVSIYLHEVARGKGLSKLLLNELITISEANNIWTLLSVIHEENTPSIKLHEQCGFRMIGYREKIAQLNGVWKTTVMMERRSKKVGI